MDIFFSNIGSFFVYTLVFLISIYMGNVYQKYNLDQHPMKWIFRLLVIMPPVLIIGLRDITVGADTYNNAMFYFRMGSDFGYITNTSSPLVGVVVHILYKFNQSYWFYFTFCSFITMYFYMKFVESFKNRISYALMLFFWYFLIGLRMTNQMRQVLSLAILLYAIGCLECGFKKKTILWSVVSIAVHPTSLLPLFIYILFKYNYMNKTRMKIFFVSIIVGAAFFSPIAQFLTILFPSNKYTQLYLSEVTGVSDVGLGWILDVLPVLVPIMVLLILYKRVEVNCWFYLGVSTVAIRFTGYYSYFLSRLYYDFLPFTFLYISTTLYGKRLTINKALVNLSVYISVIFYYCIYYFSLLACVYLPYKTIF